VHEPARGVRSGPHLEDRPRAAERLHEAGERDRTDPLDRDEDGDGEPFAPAGRVFREWVAITTIDRNLWQSVLAEAVDFARESLSDQQ
jgi:hypothetical protein